MPASWRTSVTSVTPRSRLPCHGPPRRRYHGHRLRARRRGRIHVSWWFEEWLRLVTNIFPSQRLFWRWFSLLVPWRVSRLSSFFWWRVGLDAANWLVGYLGSFKGGLQRTSAVWTTTSSQVSELWWSIAGTAWWDWGPFLTTNGQTTCWCQWLVERDCSTGDLCRGQVCYAGEGGSMGELWHAENAWRNIDLKEIIWEVSFSDFSGVVDVCCLSWIHAKTLWWPLPRLSFAGDAKVVADLQGAGSTPSPPRGSPEWPGSACETGTWAVCTPLGASAFLHFSRFSWRMVGDFFVGLAAEVEIKNCAGPDNNWRTATQPFLVGRRKTCTSVLHESPPVANKKK